MHHWMHPVFYIYTHETVRLFQDTNTLGIHPTQLLTHQDVLVSSTVFLRRKQLKGSLLLEDQYKIGTAKKEVAQHIPFLHAITHFEVRYSPMPLETFL